MRLDQSITRTVPAAVAAALVLALASASPAAASQRQIEFFDATAPLLNPSQRAATFRTLEHEGVHALRLLLYWSEVAPFPNHRKVPKLNLAEPGSYHYYLYQPVLEEAKRLGWTVLLTLTGPVPKWATAAHRDNRTRPNPRLFGEFAEATAKLLAPYVDYWGVWNEPNEVNQLLPQWNRNGSPASPAIYRALYLAAYKGLKEGGVPDPQVLFGELSPYGSSAINPRTQGTIVSMSPLEFMRAALCLGPHYQPQGRCAELPAAGFAIHPYPGKSIGPTYAPPNPDQVTLASIGRLERAINLAARAHRLPGRLPIYITEYGINSKPSISGVSPIEQAAQDALAEMMAWDNGWIASFAQYALRDDRIPRHKPRGFIAFDTGLEFANGRRKPLYYSFPVPLVVTRAGRGYQLWGHIRPAEGATAARVYVQTAANRRFRFLATVRTGPLGYWTLHSNVSGVAWKVRWTAPDGTVYEGPPIPLSRSDPPAPRHGRLRRARRRR